jgi:stage II sporulation protein D
MRVDGRLPRPPAGAGEHAPVRAPSAARVWATSLRRRLLAGVFAGLALGALLLWGCRPVAAPRSVPPTPMPMPPPEVAVAEAAPRVAERPALPPQRREESPRPAAAATTYSGPERVRVGLLTDQAEAIFPCCGDGLWAEWQGTVYARSAPVRVVPAAAGVSAGVFRLQVAALRDPGQAEALARRLQAATGLAADARIDAETGFYRVRVGRWSSREEAERGRVLLSPHGVTEAWVVGEGGGVRAPALEVVQGDRRVRVPGRWLAIRAAGEDGIRLAGRRYRDTLLLYVNDRGTLNVVNELPLDDYIRGVVPREMGPEAYPELEALKAQAVAARTYALRNLGEFTQEGFDICATPRCQVYGGMDAEHPRSDRAVAETAGVILLWGGGPIDALYSSTCGGHTENVGVVFPLKREQIYLRGVPCAEGGVQRVSGPQPAPPFPLGITRALVPPTPGTPEAAGFARRLAALARLGGLEGPLPSLSSLDGQEVRRAVARLFDLVLEARLFVAAEDLPYLLDASPPEWTDEDRRLAAFFVKAGLGGLPRGSLEEGEREELLLRLAEYLRVVVREEVRFHGLEAGRLLVRADGDQEPFSVAFSQEAWTYRRLGEETQPGELSLVAGDRLELFRGGDRLLGVVQVIHPEGVAFDRTSRWASWQRFRSDGEIAAAVRQRYPGFPFRTFEVLERGVSGRVGRLRLLGTDGRTEVVEGLAVRWTLDLPDTLFTAKRLTPQRGEAGWLFTGKGWGHGVGMCQVGAYGMAVRGHDYREILSHYYRGVELARIR